MHSHRHAVWVWYRGSRFGGFQAQPNQPTVSLALANAFARIGGGIRFSAAGRTDRGVHARMQVLSVRSEPHVRETHLLQGLERDLPVDVGVCAVVPAGKAFHAQWSCAGKEYRYRLDFHSHHFPKAWDGFAWRLSEDPRLGDRRIDPEKVRRLLQDCVGTHDFFSFHEKSSVRKPRTIQQASLNELPNGLFEIRLKGDSFARYQVRFLVGSCVAAAAGLIPRSHFRSAVDKCLPIPGIRAPAQGLVLWETFYRAGCDPFSSLRTAPPPMPSGAPFSFE